MSGLTNTTLKSLKPTGKPYQVRDSTRPGFGVQVTRQGRMVFFYRYSLNGKRVFLRLGSWGAINLDEARERYEDARNRVERLGKASRDKGDEVLEESEASSWERDAVKDAAMKTFDSSPVTVQKAFEDYITFRQSKPSTQADVRAALKKLEDWKTRPIASITPRDVLDRHRKIGAKSKARANNVMRWLRAVLNFASVYYAPENDHLTVATNPVTVLTKLKAWYPAKRKQTCLRDYELRPWFEAVQGLAEIPEREPGTGKHNPKMREGALIRDYLLFTILTGLRKMEGLGLTWDRVNFKAKTVIILDNKPGRSLVLPLTEYMVEILKRRQAEGKGPHVFSNRQGERLSNLRYALERIEKQTGIRATLHDLRRTFSRVGDNKLGLGRYTLKKLMNHGLGGDVTAGYVALYVEDLKEPMERITAYFLRAWGATPGGKVLSFERTSGAE